MFESQTMSKRCTITAENSNFRQLTMDFQKRTLPTRAHIRTPGNTNLSEDDKAGIEMVLNLLSAADTIRYGIYADLEKQGISEGKFSLMICLNSAGTLSIQEAARRMGVATATASVMIRRMLADPKPLIASETDPYDARGKLLTLTDDGKKLLEDVFPQHIESIRKFANLYNTADRDALIALLQRICAS